MSSAEFDVIVVGAGLCGIAAAKFYLDVHPECRLVMLERDGYIGGVWNARRLYTSFWTQWTVGTAEFSDMPMARPPAEDTFYDFFHARYTTDYLEKYVDQQHFAGQSLRERIRFHFHVSSIRKLDGRWSVSGTDDDAHEARTYQSSKLIVASGLTSTPLWPNLPNRERFDGLVIHQESFGQSAILSSAKIQHVTVLGGAKSAADMVYACIKAGKSVSWIVRPSGTGPGFFLSPKGRGPYKNAFELGSTRLAGTLTPSFFNPHSWWTRFLHGTPVGRKLVGSVWGAADQEVRAVFDGRYAAKGFEKLKPHSSIFWQNASGGLLNRTDFWDTIGNNVQVYEDEISGLDGHLVHLKSGEKILTDVLLCGTGWTPSLEFFDRSMLVELGLPHPLEDEPAAEAEKWARLEREADETVLRHFPQLASPPAYHQKPIDATPYRLYNGMAPLRDDSIVIVGHMNVANYFRGAECQAIWATAYLDKRVALPPLAEREAELALFIAWCRRRYLSSGRRGNFMPFELTRYTDKLLKEAGLSSHRKGWFKDFFGPTWAADLRGLREEYKAKHGSGHEVKTIAS